MIQNFEPIELERKIDYPEWSQREESNNSPHDPSHIACLKSGGHPKFCNAQPVNVDAYVPILIIIAVVFALMKLQKFKLKTNGK